MALQRPEEYERVRTRILPTLSTMLREMRAGGATNPANTMKSTQNIADSRDKQAIEARLGLTANWISSADFNDIVDEAARTL